MDIEDSSSETSTSGEAEYDSDMLGNFARTLSRRQFKALLKLMRKKDDDISLLTTMHELSNYLLMTNEEGVSNFDMDKLVPALISILAEKTNPELLILVLRTLYNLIEVRNDTAKICIDNGIVNFLLGFLRSIEYIDVAESALQVVDKLSVMFPTKLFEAGGLSAVLMYIDFFPVSQQRDATQAAANMCFKAGSNESSFAMIADSIETLSNLLSFGDSQVVENVMHCFSRILDEFMSDKEKLQVILKKGLVEKLVEIFSGPKKSMGSKLIHATRMLTQLARNNHEISIKLIELKVQEIALEHIFGSQDGAIAAAQGSSSTTTTDGGSPRVRRSSSGRFSSPGISPRMGEMMQRSIKDTIEITYLLSVLLPALPFDIFPYNTVSIILSQNDTNRKSMWVRSTNSDEESRKLAEFYESNEVYRSLVLSRVLPQLVLVARTANNKEAVYGCILAISKATRMVSGEELCASVSPTTFVDLMTHVLHSYKEELLVVSVMILLIKLLCDLHPTAFVPTLRKEGIHKEIKDIVKKEAVNFSIDRRSSAEQIIKSVLDQPGLVPEFRRGAIMQSLLQLLQAENRDVIPDSEVWKWLKKEAIGIWEEHFEETNNISEKGSRDAQTRLTGLVKDLEVALHAENAATIRIDDVAETLQESSAYQLDKSGFLSAFSRYFGDVSSVSLLETRVSLLKALQERKLEREEMWGSLTIYINNHLELLALRVNQTLEKTENFTDFTNVKASGRFRMLFNPFRVHILSHGREIGTEAVYVDSLALISNLEGFIQEKISSEVDDSEDSSPSDEDDSEGESSDEMDVDGEELNVNDQMGEETESNGSHVKDIILTSSMNVSGSPRHSSRKSKKRKHVSFSLNGVPLIRERVFIEEVRNLIGDQNLLAMKDLWKLRLKLEVKKLNAEDTEETSREKPPQRILEGGDADIEEIFRIIEEFRKESFSDRSNVDSGRRSATVELIQLLRILWRLFMTEAPITWEEDDMEGEGSVYEIFVNPQLNAKIRRQLHDPVLIASGGVLKDFRILVRQAFFLFSRDVRQLLFATSSFGLGKALHAIDRSMHSTGERSTDYRITRIPRKKVRIERERLLESALVMRRTPKIDYGILEVQYFGEKGIGLGPTLEFFNEFSKSIQEARHGLWWGSAGTSTKYVNPEHGLFPLPGQHMSQESPDSTEVETTMKKELEYFGLLGFIVAKALKDSRLMDIHFSVPFFKKAKGSPLSFEDISMIEPVVYTHLKKMKTIAEAAASGSSKDSKHLMYDERALEDLNFSFTLPLLDSIELKPGGRSMLVTVESAGEYVDLCVDIILRSGVDGAFREFEKGFSEIFPIERLAGFYIGELDSLISGSFHGITREELVSHMKCDHGYSIQSPTIQNFIDIVTNFSETQQKDFLQFVTGCPRMRVGGLAELDPPLTIVKRVIGTGTTDEYLVSASTCTNYVKIPDYSNPEILREKLLYSITEGQSNFDLS